MKPWVGAKVWTNDLKKEYYVVTAVSSFTFTWSIGNYHYEQPHSQFLIGQESLVYNEIDILKSIKKCLS